MRVALYGRVSIRDKDQNPETQLRQLQVGSDDQVRRVHERRQFAVTTAATVIQWLVRGWLGGLVIVLLGLKVWTGHAIYPVPVPMVAGLVLALSLWALALLAALSRVSRGLVALAVVWGFVVATLGIMHPILPGHEHRVVQFVYLLVGLPAIGQAEGLATRIRQARAGKEAIGGRQ